MIKKNYLDTIHKNINYMNENQLITLYNIHSDLYIKPVNFNLPDIHSFKTFKDLTFNKIKRYTPESDYPDVLYLIYLILFNYNPENILNILHDPDATN